MWATSSNLSKLDKDQSGQEYLTIKTHKGLHHYKLGAIWSLQCTSHISENLWTRFCRPGIKFTICHLDDVLIQGVRLWIWGRVLGIFKNTVSSSNLTFLHWALIFLRHWIDNNNIHLLLQRTDVIMKLSVPQVSRSWSPIWDFAIKDYMAYFCQTWSLNCTSSRTGIGGGQRNVRAMKSSLIFRAVAQ